MWSILSVLPERAVNAVAGYEKVKDWLSKEQATVLIQASDGSERGQNEIEHASPRVIHRLVDGVGTWARLWATISNPRGTGWLAVWPNVL